MDANRYASFAHPEHSQPAKTLNGMQAVKEAEKVAGLTVKESDNESSADAQAVPETSSNSSIANEATGNRVTATALRPRGTQAGGQPLAKGSHRGASRGIAGSW